MTTQPHDRVTNCKGKLMHLTAPLGATGKTHMFKSSGKPKPIMFWFSTAEMPFSVFQALYFFFLQGKTEWKAPRRTKRCCCRPPLCCCLLFSAMMLAFLRCDALTPKCCAPSARPIALGFNSSLCQTNIYFLLQINITKTPGCQYADRRRKQLYKSYVTNAWWWHKLFLSSF